MVKLTVELIEQAAQYTNPVRDRELDLRGAFVVAIILGVHCRIIIILVIMHFHTATPNSTNFASKLFYYVFFNL